MFVFYFGIMADLTPPVALAAFAAASIAKAPPMRIGWKATHIAIAGFVIPYMAVYDPALMLQPTPAGGSLSLVAALYVIAKTILAICLWGGAAIGYFLRGPISWPERVVAFASASLLVTAVPWTDQAGFIASALFILWHLWRTRGTAAIGKWGQSELAPPGTRR